MATAAVLKKPNPDFIKFHQFSKLEDSKEKDGPPTVWGVATWEQPDSDNEVCDYETAVPVYQAWSSKAFKRTSRAGQEPSLGNIRLQHGSEVGGKATKIEFDDKAKEIWLGSEPISDDVHQALKKGMYTGYSQGGSYAWRACADCEGQMPMQQGYNFCERCGKTVNVRYGLKHIAEVSYVDSPATGEGFEHVKANGSTEILKFQKKENIVSKTKTVAGVALPSHCFAYVGDPEKTDTWKLPIEFPGDKKKSQRHIRNALARFEQTKGIPEGEKDKVKAKIEAAARSHGIEVGGEKSMAGMNALKASIDKAAEAKGLAKGLYEVSRFADILGSMAYLYESAFFEAEIEGDESEVPEQLKELLASMTETFIAMAEEEARELSAKHSKGEKTMTPEELQKQQDLEKAAKKSLASHFAKAASHHEKMADHHEKLAEIHDKADVGCKDCMGKADTAKAARVEAAKAEAVAKGEVYKEDVSSGADSDGGVHEILENQQRFHKAAGAVHLKKAKAHDKHAEHLQGMAEGFDEESAKAVKAELAKAYEAEVKLEKDAAPVIVPKVEPTMEEDVRLAMAKRRNSPEYKTEVEAIADDLIKTELAEKRSKMLAPTGAGVGEPFTTADGKTFKAVARDTTKQEVELASAAPSGSFGGL
jgi:hypothetical protein